MAKTQKPLEQQIECAKARAKTAKIDLLSVYADGEGNVTWTITSERDANDWYHVRYGADNHLVCDCPAQCVCKHIGLVLNRNVNYTRTSRPATTPAAPAAVEVIGQATEAAIEAAEMYSEDYDEWAASAGALGPVDLGQTDDEAFGRWLDQETARLEEEEALAEAYDALERLWQPPHYVHNEGEVDPEERPIITCPAMTLAQRGEMAMLYHDNREFSMWA